MFVLGDATTSGVAEILKRQEGKGQGALGNK
jgi:hypothetical protein